MGKQKLIHELFVGKVVEEIGFDRALELLRASKEAIDKLYKNKELPYNENNMSKEEEPKVISDKADNELYRLIDKMSVDEFKELVIKKLQ